jgi:hypothetical protein
MGQGGFPAGTEPDSVMNAFNMNSGRAPDEQDSDERRAHDEGVLAIRTVLKLAGQRKKRCRRPATISSPARTERGFPGRRTSSPLDDSLRRGR